MSKPKFAIVLVAVAIFGLSACSSGSSQKFAPGAVLTGEDLKGRDLSGLDLSGANMTGSDLTGANLSNADLRGANLTRVDFTNAKLVGSDLSGANISGARLDGADFTNAAIDGLRLGGTSLDGVKGIPTTTLPPTTTVPLTTTPPATTTAPKITKPKASSESEVQDSPNTTPKPVYLTRTEVRTISKVIPNGPWSCERTYVYSDGKRTRETFRSETECSQ